MLRKSQQQAEVYLQEDQEKLSLKEPKEEVEIIL